MDRAVSAAGGLWGCSFLFISTALQSFSPTQVAFGRIAVGLALLVVVLLVRRERVRVQRRHIGDFVLVGAVMTAIPFVLFGLAEQRVSSVLAGLVNATTPLFTALFVALLIPAERPDRVQLGGLLVGFGGIAVLLGIWDAGAIDLVGGLMLLGATFCYGLGNAWARFRLTGSGLSTVGAPTVQLVVGALVVLPFAIAVPRPGPLEPMPALALLVLGLGGTGLAYVLFWRVMSTAGATRRCERHLRHPDRVDDARRRSCSTRGCTGSRWSAARSSSAAWRSRSGAPRDGGAGRQTRPAAAVLAT